MNIHMEYGAARTCAILLTVMLCITVGVGYAHHEQMEAATELTIQQFGAFALALLISLGMNVYLARRNERLEKQNLDLHHDHQAMAERFIKALTQVLRYVERSGGPNIGLDQVLPDD